MIQQKLFKSVLFEPTCTTFSPAAHSACRSYSVPEGWDRLLPKVFHGTMLAFRCLFLVYVCVLNEAPAGVEQSRLSKVAWLKAWKWLLTVGCSEAVVASCQFGSVHRKEFRLLVYLLDTVGMTVKCGGGHKHIRIQGSYTKASAIYAGGVTMHLARAFSSALRAAERSAEAVLSRCFQMMF